MHICDLYLYLLYYIFYISTSDFIARDYPKLSYYYFTRLEELRNHLLNYLKGKVPQRIQQLFPIKRVVIAVIVVIVIVAGITAVIAVVVVVVVVNMI